MSWAEYGWQIDAAEGTKARHTAVADFGKDGVAAHSLQGVSCVIIPTMHFAMMK